MSFNGTVEGEAECAMFQGDRAKCTALIVVKRVSACLSIVGAAFTLFLIVLYKKYTARPQRMIFHLALASLMYAISYLLVDIVYEISAICRAQGALVMFLIWVCCLWIMSILLDLYFKVVWSKNVLENETLQVFVCWGVPALLASLPFIDDAYAPAGVWCWLTNDWRWRFGLWYIWRILSILIFVVLMAHIIIVMYRNKGHQHHSTTLSYLSVEGDIRTLRLYPIVYFLINIFPIINRVYNAIGRDNDQQGYNFPLLLLQSMCDPLFGATVAVVYVLDKDTRSRLSVNELKRAFQKWISRAPAVREYNLDVRT